MSTPFQSLFSRAALVVSAGLVVLACDPGGPAPRVPPAPDATGGSGGSATGGTIGTPASGGSGGTSVPSSPDAASAPAVDAAAVAVDGASAPGDGAAPTGAVVVTTAMNGKQTIMGPYNPPPEATLMPGAPPAMLDKFVYDTSKFFPGNSHNIAIFIPAQYVPNTEVPFIVIQDGEEQLNAYKTDIVLTNLIHQKRLPVMAALFVNRPDNGPKRSLEYDCLDDDYSRMVLDELIPLAKMRHPELKLTEDPNGRGSLGKSPGAPAAFTLGWRHPESFTRITTFNGSFVNLCKDGPGASTYPKAVRDNPMKPLRVYMFSGDGDNGGFAAGNEALSQALDSKGYPWRYVFGVKTTHSNVFASTLITEALLWTWAGYPIGQ